MDYALYPEIFADMFPRELQPYREQIAAAKAIEAEAKAIEAEAKAIEAEAKAIEAEAKAIEAEANARADKLDRLLCESTRVCILLTIKARRWFEETPQSLVDDLERITSYENLNNVLTTAESSENYELFLKALESVKE